VTLRYWGAVQLLAALLFVAQPLAEGVHHLTSPHFWCLEHHAFEHTTTEPAAKSDARDVAAGVALSGGSSSDAEHDACLAISSTHRLLRDPVSVCGVCVAFVRSVPLAVRACSHSQGSVLNCAPKHSPPVTGALTPWASRAS